MAAARRNCGNRDSFIGVTTINFAARPGCHGTAVGPEQQAFARDVPDFEFGDLQVPTLRPAVRLSPPGCAYRCPARLTLSDRIASQLRCFHLLGLIRTAEACRLHVPDSVSHRAMSLSDRVQHRGSCCPGAAGLQAPSNRSGGRFVVMRCRPGLRQYNADRLSSPRRPLPTRGAADREQYWGELVCGRPPTGCCGSLHIAAIG